jgi:head-tail adaptor
MDRLITIEQKSVTLDATYGTEIVSWVPLMAEAGSPPVAVKFKAEIQDAMPSRSESVQQGLPMARNQTRCRIRWRDDVNSSMRVTLHGDSDVVYQIVGGPADIEGRKQRIEMVLEKYSS